MTGDRIQTCQSAPTNLSGLLAESGVPGKDKKRPFSGSSSNTATLPGPNGLLQVARPFGLNGDGIFDWQVVD
ncbi:MAG: hypothetical protein EA359_14835 [Balneolaceae bacterium]|nr:MAG: hypothetical protein EA359_14835 [Balneolaceae bacterium]